MRLTKSGNLETTTVGINVESPIADKVRGASLSPSGQTAKSAFTTLRSALCLISDIFVLCCGCAFLARRVQLRRVLCHQGVAGFGLSILKEHSGRKDG